MDKKETSSIYRSDNILLSDSSYYKYIFKKTEKIVCAVFYIIDSVDNGGDKRHVARHAEALAAAAGRAHEAVLATLTVRWYAADDHLYALLSALVSLESQIRIAAAARLLEHRSAEVLIFELQNVLRGLRQYLARERATAPSLADFEAASPGTPAPHEPHRSAASPQPPQRISPGEHKGHGTAARAERQQAIKDVLASKGQSTIKDISENVQDCSEKTIQRELNALIDAGIVRKEGERRWSRYALAERS